MHRVVCYILIDFNFISQYDYVLEGNCKKVQTIINFQKSINQNLCKTNKHILQVHIKHDILRIHDKIIYHKKKIGFFLKYLYIQLGNTLLVDNMPYKCCKNLAFNIIFFHSYEEEK